VRQPDPGTYALKLPGMPAEVRATTSGEVFEYSDNHELLSPGGAVFDRLSEENPYLCGAGLASTPEGTG
jgi:hypothetical protein